MPSDVDDHCDLLQWYEQFSGIEEVIAVSAKFGHGIDELKDWIVSKLPVGPPYYPKVNPVFFMFYF